MTDYPLFQKYANAILAYRGDALAAELLMASSGPISVYYAPFDWVNPAARVVIVGITPGRKQAEKYPPSRPRIAARPGLHHALQAGGSSAVRSGGREVCRPVLRQQLVDPAHRMMLDPEQDIGQIRRRILATRFGRCHQ